MKRLYTITMVFSDNSEFLLPLLYASPQNFEPSLLEVASVIIQSATYNEDKNRWEGQYKNDSGHVYSWYSAALLIADSEWEQAE